MVFTKDCALLWLCVSRMGVVRGRGMACLWDLVSRDIESALKFCRCDSGQHWPEISHGSFLECSGCFQEDRRSCGFNKSTNVTYYQSKHITQVTLYSCALWPSEELPSFLTCLFSCLVGFFIYNVWIHTMFVSFWVCNSLKGEKKKKQIRLLFSNGRKNKCLAVIRVYCHRTKTTVVFLSKSATLYVLLHDKLTIISS